MKLIKNKNYVRIIFVFIFILYISFLSFEQKLLHLPSVYWLTYSLICPHNTLKNMAKAKKSYSGQTLTRFKAASHLANAPWR